MSVESKGFLNTQPPKEIQPEAQKKDEKKEIKEYLVVLIRPNVILENGNPKPVKEEIQGNFKVITDSELTTSKIIDGYGKEYYCRSHGDYGHPHSLSISEQDGKVMISCAYCGISCEFVKK